jgi:hypothetical protein
MGHAGHANREPIQQEDTRSVPRCFGNGGLWHFQHVAEQNGFSSLCHGAHAARAGGGVKHHGAPSRFVLP